MAAHPKYTWCTSKTQRSEAETKVHTTGGAFCWLNTYLWSMVWYILAIMLLTHNQQGGDPTKQRRPSDLQERGQPKETPEAPNTTESLHTNWLEDADMLPLLLPKARILRYGYASQGWGPEGTQTDVRTIGRKLLAHLSDLRKVGRH
jgi:hypothetical protein